MNFTLSNIEIIISILTTGLIIIVLILEFNKSLKARINLLIGLLYIIIALLIVNAYMQYPQYKNTKDIQNTIREMSETFPRTHGAG